MSFFYRRLAFHCVFFFIFNHNTVNSNIIDEVDRLFERKHCIEGSLVSHLWPETSIMLERQDRPESFAVADSDADVAESKQRADSESKVALSKINELAQYNNLIYTFELISEEGPPHSKLFKIVLRLGDEVYEGSGYSMKTAQQQVALVALEETNYEHPPVKLKPEEEVVLTPTVALNNVAMKLGIAVQYFLMNGKEEKAISSVGASFEPYGKTKNYFTQINATNNFKIPLEDSQLAGPFAVKVKVFDSEFIGLGHSIQAARHDAALKALEHMEKQVLSNNDDVCLNEASAKECKERKEQLKSPISRVYEAGQKHNLAVEFSVVEESGKSHVKRFVTECKLGDFIVRGEGSSKKESKRLAAENMLVNLQFLPDTFDVNYITKGLSPKKKNKKKKNIIKKDTSYLTQTVKEVLSSFCSTQNGDTNNKDQRRFSDERKNQDSSFKNKLLGISNKLNIIVDFTDMGKKGDVSYAIVSLGGQPLQICMGKANSREAAHDKAALHGLKFLYKSGAFESIKSSLQSTDSIFYIPEEVLSSEEDSTYYLDDSISIQ